MSFNPTVFVPTTQSKQLQIWNLNKAQPTTFSYFTLQSMRYQPQIQVLNEQYQ